MSLRMISSGRNLDMPGVETMDLSRTIGWLARGGDLILEHQETENLQALMQSITRQVRQFPRDGILEGLIEESAKNLGGATPRVELLFNYFHQSLQSAEEEDEGTEEALQDWDLSSLAIPKPGLPPSSDRCGDHRRGHILLECRVIVIDGCLSIRWQYSKNIHKQSTIARIADDFMNALRALIHNNQPEEEQPRPLTVDSTRIAGGASADILTWGENQVLKLNRTGAPIEDAEIEAEIIRTVHAAGVRVPAVGGVTSINGRHGVILERIDGTIMGDLGEISPEDAVCRLAEIQAAMHTPSIDGLTPQHKRLTEKINETNTIPSDAKQVILSHLAQLPDGNTICHRDLHIHNVMETDDGPVILDWTDATQGYFLGDVVQTSLIIRFAPLPFDTSDSMRRRIIEFRHKLNNLYLERYSQHKQFSQEAFARWEVPVAAARLADSVDPYECEELWRIVEIGLRST